MKASGACHASARTSRPGLCPAFLFAAPREREWRTTSNYRRSRSPGVVARVQRSPATLARERQQEVAQVLLAFLEQQNPDLHLRPEQIIEIERCMSDDVPFASEEEVHAVFARLTK